MRRGLVHRLRYRVLNSIGWSSYSPNLFALAATVPTRPASPYLKDATATSIRLGFYESTDSGGSKITGYELYKDSGLQGSSFSKVSSYTDNSMETTITADITAGSTYTFKFRCFNKVGFSEFSEQVRFAIASPPAKPLAPTKDMHLSTRTSIFVKWSESQPTEIPILGYKLLMSNATSQYVEVYSNSKNSLQR